MKAFRYLSLAILLVFLATGKSLQAQEMIDEDFLDVLSTNVKEVWDEKDNDFSVTKAPAKWVDESAVAIAYKKHILFDKKRSGLLGGKEKLVLVERKHMKVILQDRQAVNDFSELYFRYSSKMDGFGAVVYKTDGTRKDIPLIRAVSIEDNDNVPEFFKSFFDQNVSNRNEYYKVPVADLLPGDILEFVSVTSSTLDVKKTPYFTFDPQYELCQKVMPLMVHKILIETDNNSFITARSINGAPDFQPSANGDFTVYSWVDKDRDRLKDANFVNEYLVLPMVKFQIIYTDGRDIKSLFAGSKGQMRSSFSEKEIGEKAYANYLTTGRTGVYGASATVDMIGTGLWTKLKNNGGKDVNEEDFIRQAYYYIRHTQVFNSYYYSDQQFVYLMAKLLGERKIASEVVVTTPNNLTIPANLLFESELAWCLRVKNKFIFKATEHSNLYDVDERFTGNEAYVLSANPKNLPEKIRIPDAKADDSKGLFQCQVVLDSSKKWLNVIRTSAYTGIQKERNSGYALRFTPYMFTDTRTYFGPDDMDGIPQKYADQFYQQKKAITDEFKERKPEYMKEQLSREFDGPVTYQGFDMVAEGRSYKKPELMFKETFQVGGLVRKAGKKFLVNLSGLMGGQLHLGEDDRTREFDADLRYPRKLRWQINFTIPAGYTVEGYNELATNVETEAGSFITSATLKDNVLTLDIQKIYKLSQVKRENWKQVLAFVDAAGAFTNRLILLKPAQ